MKRIFATLTAAALLLVSCGSAGISDDTTASTDTTVGETDDGRFKASVPENLDFEGYTFHIYTYSGSDANWYDADFSAESENGDLLNDAAYKRMRYAEDLLNINIESVHLGNFHGTDKQLIANIAAGDSAYDAAMLNMHSAAALSIGGYLCDLNEVPGMELANPWWDKNAVSDLEVGGRLYMVTGDLSIMYKKSIGIILFNKEMYENFGFENAYTLVNEKRWTIDRLYEFSAAAAKDLDGNEKMDENDQFGMLFQNDMASIGLIGAGVRFVEKDASGYPTPSFYNERTVSAYEKYARIFNDKTISDNTQVTNRKHTPIFTSGNALFLCSEFHKVEPLRQMDTDFGILPIPLYDEEQEKYHHSVNPYVCAMLTIPADCPDRERAGYILEVLAAESKNVLTPAYYDVYLKTKASRDNDSEQIIDLILETMRYDLGYMYDWGGIGSIPLNLAAAYKDDLTSAYKIRENLILAAIDDAVTAFKEIAND